MPASQNEKSNLTYCFRLRDSLLGGQMLFVAFGSLVLVPVLTGLDPSVALFTAGAGTLIFQVITRGRIPVFLASSFAFIDPIINGVGAWGIPATLCGLAAAGLFYVFLSGVIACFGTGVIHRILPPVVTGPVIMVIGLSLASVAVNLATGKTGDGTAVLFPRDTAIIIAMCSLLTTILISLLGRGMLRLVPILGGIAVGYVVSFVYNIVDVSPVAKAAWLTVPGFVAPQWNWQAVLFFLPVAIAPAIEHFGDVLAVSSVTGKNYIKDPGVKRTMLGDGIATTLAACLGGPPNTTYSEVTGAVALTRVYNPAVMTWAALAAILLAFVGKLGALLQTIPTPVMGGITILLFGMITVLGINALVKSGEDLSGPRNMTIVAVILVFGIGGMSLGTAQFSLGGIGLAGVVGVVLNLILPGKRA